MIRTRGECARLAKGIVKVTKFLNSIRVRCAEDLCCCARTLEKAVERRGLNEKFEELLAEFGLEVRDVASERLCDTDLIAYGEWQYLHGDRPVAKAVIRVRHGGGAIGFEADVVEIYDGEVKREVCRAMPSLGACATQISSAPGG